MTIQQTALQAFMEDNDDLVMPELFDEDFDDFLPEIDWEEDDFEFAGNDDFWLM